MYARVEEKVDVRDRLEDVPIFNTPVYVVMCHSPKKTNELGTAVNVVSVNVLST